MDPIVQSAIDAANEGDKPKAIELVRQALTANPNDMDAWLVLAAVMDDPQRKRQCLNRVLTIDPTNTIARDELLDMDRAYMSAVPSQPVEEPISTDQPQPEPTPYSSSAFTYESAPAIEQTQFPAQPPTSPKTLQPKPASRPQAEKPQVFKYSLVTRIMTYVFFVLFGCLTLIAFQSLTAALVPCSLSLIMLPVIWIVSAQVEVSEKGIRTSQLFGLTSNYASWEGIASIKSNSMQQNLQLTTKKGNTIKVSSQVKGYPIIVETLRRKRPDLFGAAPVVKDPYSSGMESSPSMGSISSVPSFAGTRTFNKNFFRQYGILLIVIPLCFFAVWIAITTPENRVGALIAAGFCGIMVLIPFFQVSSVKVEPDKLTIETMFEEKTFSAGEIREIKMQSVRGRHGRVTNFVNIIPANGKNYPLQGFSDGHEIIYGILSNWWNAHQSR
jgi:hypothetical protein